MFGADRIISLMQKMGYTEHEKVQHSMIDNSLQRAQNKIAENLTYDTSIKSSQADWFNRNAIKLTDI
jgi:preprotein translocase subunit SecA